MSYTELILTVPSELYFPEKEGVTDHMLFISFSFAVFLPIVFGIYWVMPHKFRWVVLLMSSCYFYMSWNTKYIILILFTTFVSYISAILIERFDNKPACARPADAPPSHESLAGAWGIPEFMPPNRRRDFHSKKNMMLAVTLISSTSNIK